MSLMLGIFDMLTMVCLNCCNKNSFIISGINERTKNSSFFNKFKFVMLVQDSILEDTLIISCTILGIS